MQTLLFVDGKTLRLLIPKSLFKEDELKSVLEENDIYDMRPKASTSDYFLDFDKLDKIRNFLNDRGIKYYDDIQPLTIDKYSDGAVVRGQVFGTESGSYFYTLMPKLPLDINLNPPGMVIDKNNADKFINFLLKNNIKFEGNYETKRKRDLTQVPIENQQVIIYKTYRQGEFLRLEFPAAKYPLELHNDIAKITVAGGVYLNRGRRRYSFDFDQRSEIEKVLEKYNIIYYDATKPLSVVEYNKGFLVQGELGDKQKRQYFFETYKPTYIANPENFVNSGYYLPKERGLEFLKYLNIKNIKFTRIPELKSYIGGKNAENYLNNGDVEYEGNVQRAPKSKPKKAPSPTRTFIEEESKKGSSLKREGRSNRRKIPSEPVFSWDNYVVVSLGNNDYGEEFIYVKGPESKFNQKGLLALKRLGNYLNINNKYSFNIFPEEEEKVKDVLKQNNIPYYLYRGTLTIGPYDDNNMMIYNDLAGAEDLLFKYNPVYEEYPNDGNIEGVFILSNEKANDFADDLEDMAWEEGKNFIFESD